MSIFCKLEDLKNESDVEQKLVWPMLTSPEPTGLGYAPAELYTKTNIRNLEIEKSPSKKIYRPDYVILIAGLPLVVIEVKRPDEDLTDALREARMYATEINALHRAGVNPCFRLVVTNGKQLFSSPSDSAVVDCQIDFADMNLGSQKYHDFLNLLKRSSIQQHADLLRRNLRKRDYKSATHLLGGRTARNEEVGYNAFGAKISIDFLHVFSPRTQEERADVVRNAYVPSRRREHYTDEIDRVIRTAMPAPVSEGTLIEDTSSPAELLRLLGRGRDLQNKLFLLVGAVGSGKSTFVDYFREVKLDEKIKKTTVWVNVDLNDAPTNRESLEGWVVEEIVRSLRNSHLQEDLGEYEMLLKVFSAEINDLKKAELKRISADSPKYIDTISDELRKLRGDSKSHAKALARFLCSERGKLLVLVLDNCDKGDLGEQLAVFQIVRWVQSWLKCLVFLPIRDVTYHAHKNKPPLDTVIKDFVFRIESPPFGEVLRKRILLALSHSLATHEGRTLDYTLESGIRVVYPATEVGFYLACIFRSLYEHDRLLRRMLVGLAGKNMRKAMEIFINFCKSGHIGAKEYLHIRTKEGKHILPYKVVMRVLLRQNRRFYDGDESHVKNLFQCFPGDARPDHFVRLAILRWLEGQFGRTGPTGVKAFHRVDRMIADLLPFGHDAQRIRQELKYLVGAMCVLTEHQRTDEVFDEDLICLSPAGFAHLSMVWNFDYLAACSEDTWVSEVALAQRIAERIGRGGPAAHYSRETTRSNASEFVEHLVADASEEVSKPKGFMEDIGRGTLDEIVELKAQVTKRVDEEREKDKWHQVEGKFTIGDTYLGTVDGTKDFGVFVSLDDGPKGLLHVSKMPKEKTPSSFQVGDRIQVRVLSINREDRRIALSFSN